MPKILGETNFGTREIPRSGSKAEDGGKKERRAKVGDNNGQATHGARKPPGPKREKVSDYNGQYMSPEPTKTVAFNFTNGLLYII